VAESPYSDEQRQVTVWRIGLDLDDPVAESLRRHLSDDEAERLRRLSGSEIGRRWLVSRAALREILAAELGVSPSAVRLQLGAYGRPHLDPGVHGSDLDFNLSHSADLALAATGRGVRIGIDVERLRPGRDPLRIAKRYFSDAEGAVFQTAPPADRPALFLRYWTAKEALAKGLGIGLKAPWAELELRLESDVAIKPLHQPKWRLVELDDLPDGYCATLAVDIPAAVVVRDWVAGQEPAHGPGN
jgi:4'-phosphopantetheinyl transferase